MWLSHRTDREYSPNTSYTLPLIPLCSHHCSFFLDSSLSLTLSLFQFFQAFLSSFMKPSMGAVPRHRCSRVSCKVVSIPKSTVGQEGIPGPQFCVIQNKIDAVYAVTGEVLAQGRPSVERYKFGCPSPVSSQHLLLPENNHHTAL